MSRPSNFQNLTDICKGPFYPGKTIIEMMSSTYCRPTSTSSLQHFGDMIGNASRGEWGQFEAVKSESTVTAVKKPAAAAAVKGAFNQLGQSAVLSAPGSSALQLLANFTKHREMFGTGNYEIE
ncbi:hypothetical protein DFA_09994 [Cavenderia fasciculata]|uniref:Uncharacterized protein n=1 Tax=Cavenderia fasciculata TaxID=261658 RepID=F4Q8Z9_CACFS|nr:uncharacterized protein DFA_09994 [Cavenderia fasciculata]EGG15168.1 hypothetical protein DFA_09994 [Cavenderia fasciculata]|eukprot:XP_004351888.1 hypothetical protein DFA_09994 [Cavenderia fasciculata]